jgi:signal transduction histidine kinase
LHFDFPTLLMAHALVMMTLALVFAVFARAQGTIAGPGLWAGGAGLVGLGTMLVGARGIVPDVVSIVVANPMILVGAALYANGIRRFNGAPSRWAWVGASVPVLAALLAYWAFVSPDLRARVVAVTLMLGAASGLCALELLRGARADLRRTARLGAVAFAAIAAAMLVRAFAVAFAGSVRAPMGPEAAASIQFLVSVTAGTASAFCLMAMAAHRLRNEVEARGCELAQLAEERDGARRRAEAASAAKTTFLATISHELRTPLNAVIGFSDVMRNELLGPLGDGRYREYANDIHVAGEHLLGLINTLLDLTKAEAGKLEVKPERVGIAEIVDIVLRLTQEAARRQGVALSARTPDAAVTCHADERALRQILLNLVSNAIKFTLPGGAVELVARRTADGGASFEVIDNGIGIATDDLERVMKPFEQAQRPSYAQAPGGGTGLGLPVVDALVRLHCGRLEIASVLGRGTTVRVFLPPPQALSRSRAPETAA